MNVASTVMAKYVGHHAECKGYGSADDSIRCLAARYTARVQPRRISTRVFRVFVIQREILVMNVRQ